jgi:hypothetical protein
MSEAWEKREIAIEEAFFAEQNAEAIKRLQLRLESSSSIKPRLSPISGNEMIPRTLFGVVVDVCPDSGGIFLDKGELEEIVRLTKEEEPKDKGFLKSFFGSILKA